MKKKTNLQKCLELKSQIDSHKELLLSAHSFPKTGYIIEGHDVIEVLNTKLKVTTLRDPEVKEIKKRPSAKQVDSYENLLKVVKSKGEESIYIHFEAIKPYGRVSWAKKINEAPKIYSDKSEAEKVAKLAKIEYDKIYKAKDGQFNCGYCRKATDNEKMVKREIFYIGRCSFSGDKKSMTKVGSYCSEQCGVYDQMGHEG